MGGAGGAGTGGAAGGTGGTSPTTGDVECEGGVCVISGAIVDTDYSDNASLVILTNTGTLSQTTLATASSALIKENVSAFDLVPDSFGSVTKDRIAFTIPSGTLAGIYVAAL
jgi:hypothetical protein